MYWLYVADLRFLRDCFRGRVTCIHRKRRPFRAWRSPIRWCCDFHFSIWVSLRRNVKRKFVRLVSESKMLKGGTEDKLSTSCMRFWTCSSSEESSIVMLWFGLYSEFSNGPECISSLSVAVSEIVSVLRCSCHCKKWRRSFELSLFWKGNSSTS